MEAKHHLGPAYDAWDAGIRTTFNEVKKHLEKIQVLVHGAPCTPGQADLDDIDEMIRAIHIVALHMNKHLTREEYAKAIEQYADGTYDMMERSQDEED